MVQLLSKLIAWVVAKFRRPKLASVTLGRPTYLRGVTIPTPESWAKLNRYTHLLWYKGHSHKSAMHEAYGVADCNAERLMRDFVTNGTLKILNATVEFEQRT